MCPLPVSDRDREFEERVARVVDSRVDERVRALVRDNLLRAEQAPRSLPPSKLAASGAASGDGLVWNGSMWVPTAIATQAELDAVAAAKQPLDGDLTALAALAGTKGDMIVHNGTAWELLEAAPSDGCVTTSDTTQTGGAKWSRGEAWTTPTLGSGWSHYDGAGTDLVYGLCQYSKDPGGVVRLKGMVEGTAGASGTIFTLPAGYRPAQDLIFDQRGNYGGTEASYRVTISTFGAVAVVTTASAFTFLSLALEFRAEDWALIVANLDPVAWWRLGETSGTTAADSSGNGYSGTINGNPTLGVTGAITNDGDKAIDLDGTGDYVSVPYSAALNPAQFTYSAWIYRDTDTGTTEHIMVSINGAATQGVSFRIGATDKLEGSFRGSATPVGATPITTGAWHHVCLSYDGGTGRLYLDGALDGSAATTLTQNTSGATTIGYTSFSFNGKIDEAILFDRWLTSHEIRMLYALGL